jgi:hypothetical protein
MFSGGLIMDGDKFILQIRGETRPDVPQPNEFMPERELGRAEMLLGVEHDIEYEVIDDHGGPNGAIRVMLDGKPVCNFIGATGYGYVDALINAYGKPRTGNSYEKCGIYAGLGSGDVPPANTFVAYQFRFV